MAASNTISGNISIDEVSKFPRTRHLFAVGKGVSRDDLVMDKLEEELFYTTPRNANTARHVSIEEKVDGANLGISINKSYQILCQNRSHIVNSKTHKQFTGLDSWIETHSSDLFRILEPDRHILFGEWLYAKHSIHYTQLPSLFLAFDIYDRQYKKFYSLRHRNTVLDTTAIQYVHLIQEIALNNRKDILNMLGMQQSQYYTGPVEGLYFRIDDDSPFSNPAIAATHSGMCYNVYRGKVVKEEFLTGIEEQWTRQAFTKNIVLY